MRIDAQCTGRHFRLSGNLFRCALNFCQRRRHALDVASPGLRQRNAAGGTVKQTYVEPRLQSGDGVADSGGRHAQLPGGRSEALAVGYGKEDFQFSQTATVHNYPDFRDRLC